MARTKKIDNALLKRFERDESGSKRKVNIRDKRVYFLIVCEGEKTEPNYFESFKRNLPPYTLDIIVEGKGYDPIGVVNAAIEKKRTSAKPVDSVWAVFDKDDFPSVNFHQAIRTASQHGIKCAWSNEAFELWFILHFQYMNTPLSRTTYQKYIEREINSKIEIHGTKAEKKKGYKYAKKSTDTYSYLQKFGNEEQAIKWAKKLQSQYQDESFAEHNPCTTVYQLVEELNNPGSILE